MILDSLVKYKDTGLLISRIIIGLSYIIVHGASKMFGGAERWEKIGGAMTNLGIDFLPAVWGFAASIAEFIGGILILIGLFFRPASIFILITMLVAASRHFFDGDPLNKIAYPIEMAAVFILYLFIGAGKYSLDAVINKRKSKA